MIGALIFRKSTALLNYLTVTVVINLSDREIKHKKEKNTEKNEKLKKNTEKYSYF